MNDVAGDAADQSALQKLGYRQELLRSMGTFQNFALSFSIISILTGAVLLYGDGLKWGGPIMMTIGWPVVSVLTMAIAASLGELASAYPTAGALYHWASILGGKGTGWATAWLNMLGQFAVTASVDFGLAKFIAPLLHIEESSFNVTMLFLVILGSHGVLNHVGVKLVGALNTVSAWYHVAGVVLIVVVAFAFGQKQPMSFLFVHYQAEPTVLLPGILMALLQPAWTFTGYDASAHASEETHDAAVSAPRGIVLSVAVSAAAGWVMLLAVTLLVRSLENQAAVSNAFIVILSEALGTMGTVLSWLCAGAMWFCGLSSVTSNSRMLYAFARDGGLPFSKSVARVSERTQSPFVAVWVSVGMAVGIARINEGVFTVMTALSTVALYASYGIPIWVGFRQRQMVLDQRPPWNLGTWTPLINIVALVWIVFISVVMMLPPNESAGYTFAGTCAALFLAWHLGVKKRFRGPPVLHAA